MHAGFKSHDVGGDRDVLGEVLGHAAADHKQAGVLLPGFPERQFQEIFHAVDGDFGFFAALLLVGDQAEPRRAVAEGGAEDRDLLAIGFKDNAVVSLASNALQIGAHLDQELARGIRARLDGIGDLPHGVVADAQLLFVDERIVDAVDTQLQKLAVIHTGFQAFVGDVMPEAEGFKEILVHDVGAGGDDGIRHIRPNHLDENFLEAGADQ